MTYVFGLDVWEGSLDISEPDLVAGGVSFLIPRLNSISGALHLDDNFLAQWEQAAPFVRFPYFVYSPWSSGRVNFDFMMAYLPKGIKRIAIDVEVVRTGYSPIEYAANVQAFVNLCVGAGLWPVIYTGGWFASNLSQWPKVEYWWARYPYSMYPSESRRVSWAELRTMLDGLAWNPACTLGVSHLWQCSGDRLKPYPGCNDRAVDVNIWQYSLDELREWAGVTPPAATWGQRVTAALSALGQDVGEPPEGV